MDFFFLLIQGINSESFVMITIEYYLYYSLIVKHIIMLLVYMFKLFSYFI